MARLIIEDVTIDRTATVISLRVRFRGGQLSSLDVAVPPRAWQARQTQPRTLATLDQLLVTFTDGQAARALNDDGHRSGSGQPFTASIVFHLRRANNLASHAERLRAQGKLTMPELAQRLGVHTSTIKAWNKAGFLASHQADDRNVRLFDPPAPGDPRLIKKMGSSSFNLLASSAFMPPYWLTQRYQVAGVTSRYRATSAISLPSTKSFWPSVTLRTTCSGCDGVASRRCLLAPILGPRALTTCGPLQGVRS
jgi:MerR HTH family regulatory protein